MSLNSELLEWMILSAPVDSLLEHHPAPLLKRFPRFPNKTYSLEVLETGTSSHPHTTKPRPPPRRSIFRRYFTPLFSPRTV